MALFPSGSLLIPSDGLDNPDPFGVAISPVDGSFLGKPSLAAAESGSMGGNGIFALLVSTDSSGSGFGTVVTVNLYDLNFTLIASITPASFPSYLFSAINTDWAHTFYYASDDNKLRTVSDAGVAGATTWDLSSTIGASGNISPMAPSRDGTILYYGDNRPVAFPVVASGSPLHRLDLVNHVALSDLLPGELGITLGLDMLVLPDGSFLIEYVPVTNGQPIDVRRYDASGTLLNTYHLGSDAESFDLVQLALDPADATFFWARTFPDATGDTSTFRKIRLSDGTVLTTFTVTDNVAGGPPPTSTGVPASCPLLVMSLASATGTIIVQKITEEGGACETDFPFVATGLTPTSFTLADGESRTFANVAAGSGFGISETTPAGFAVSYHVSNGSPIDDLTVAAGETVTVIVTNTPLPPFTSCWSGGQPSVSCAAPNPGPTQAACWSEFVIDDLRIGLKGA